MNFEKTIKRLLSNVVNNTTSSETDNGITIVNLEPVDKNPMGPFLILWHTGANGENWRSGLEHEFWDACFKTMNQDNPGSFTDLMDDYDQITCTIKTGDYAGEFNLESELENIFESFIEDDEINASHWVQAHQDAQVIYFYIEYQIFR